MKRNNFSVFCLVFSVFFIGCNTAWAGFLEMPDIEEIQEAENEILLKDLDIPGVQDRIPDPEAGPRINVTAFRIQGVQEFPELGITRKEIIKLVEESRYNIMKEGKMLYSGYTNEELSELQDLIVDIEKETRDVHVDPLDVQRLVFLIRDQRRRRGVTLGMLEDVADKVTKYYRQRGFILAKAFIPEQKVRDGVVTLTLLLGDLGQIDFVNNKRYSKKIADKIFADVMYKPVTTEVMERKLYYLNDMPGLNVQGFFGPGEQVGDTKLSIKVEQEETFNMNFRLDNHGSDVTGEYRLYADFILNNPLKYGDKFHVSLLGAVDPETAQYGALRYGGPLLSHRWHYELGASQNAFVLGLEQDIVSSQGGVETVLDIGGESEIFDVGVNYQLTRSRVNNTLAGVTLYHIDATVDSLGEPIHDVVDNIKLHYSFDLLQQKARIIHNGSVSLTRTMIDESPPVDQGPKKGEAVFSDAWLLSFNYTSLRFIKPFWKGEDMRWVIRSGGQYSGQKLSSINQFSLAGPTQSRGYKTNTFFADTGLYVGSELLFDVPKWPWLGKLLQPYVFSDLAYGETYIPDKLIAFDKKEEIYADVKNTALLFNVGFGAKFSFLDGVRGNLSIGKPVKTDIDADLDIVKVDAVKVYFDMQYSL